MVVSSSLSSSYDTGGAFFSRQFYPGDTALGTATASSSVSLSDVGRSQKPHTSQQLSLFQNSRQNHTVAVAKEYSTEQEFVQEVFQLIPPSASSSGFLRYCVDVGAQADGEEDGGSGSGADSVTHALLVRGDRGYNNEYDDDDESDDDKRGQQQQPQHFNDEWFGILIQPNSLFYRRLQQVHQPLGNRLLQITPSAQRGLNERSLVWILRQYTPELPSDFDFLCLAGIGWSYWIVRDFFESQTFQPKVVCVPYDSKHDNLMVHVPSRQEKDGLPSILALIDLMSDHKYQLVMLTKWCAFFVPDIIYETYLKTMVSPTDIRHKSSSRTNPLLLTPVTVNTNDPGQLGGRRISNKVQRISNDDDGVMTPIIVSTVDSHFDETPQISHSNTMKTVWMSQRKNHIQASRNLVQSNTNTTKNTQGILSINFKDQLASSWANTRAPIRKTIGMIGDHRQQQQQQQHPQQKQPPSSLSGKRPFQIGGSGSQLGLEKVREVRKFRNPIRRRKAEDPPEIRDGGDIPRTSQAMTTNITSSTVDERERIASPSITRNKSTRRVQLKLPGSDDPPAPTISERCWDSSTGGISRAVSHQTVTTDHPKNDEHGSPMEKGSAGPIPSDGENLATDEDRNDLLQIIESQRDEAHFGSLEDYQSYLHKLVFSSDENDDSVIGMDKPDENDNEEEIVFVHQEASDTPRKEVDAEVVPSTYDGIISNETGDGLEKSNQIDLRSFCIQNNESNSTARQACASKMISALKEKGYALVHGSGISRFLCQDALSASQLLLDETAESVRRCCISENDLSRGYSPLCTERSGDVNLSDMVRRFRVGSSDLEDQPNIWPQHDNMDEETTEYIRASFQNYHDNMRVVATAIIECLCKGRQELNHGITQPSWDQLSHIVGGIDSSILTAVNCGRGSRHIADKPLVAPHVDPNVISIVILDGGDCATFQYETEDGDWKSILLPRVIPDDPIFLVYAGQGLRSWSNGYFPSKCFQILPAGGSQTLNGLIFSLRQRNDAVKPFSGQIVQRSEEKEEPNSAITNIASQLREISATFESMIMAEFTESSSFGANQLSIGEESDVTFDKTLQSRKADVQAGLSLSSGALKSSFEGENSLSFDKAEKRDGTANRTLDSLRRDAIHDPSVKNSTTTTVIATARAARRETSKAEGSEGIENTKASELQQFEAAKKRENPFRVAREKLLAKYSHGPNISVAATGKDEIQRSRSMSSPQQQRSEILSRLLPQRFKKPISPIIKSLVEPPSSSNNTNSDVGDGKMSMKQKVQERIEQLKRQKALERQARKEKNLKNQRLETDQEEPHVGEAFLTTFQLNGNSLKSFSQNKEMYEPDNKLFDIPGTPRRPIPVDIQDPPGSPTRPIKVEDGFPVLTYLGCTSSSFQRESSSFSNMHLEPVASDINSTVSFSDRNDGQYFDTDLGVSCRSFAREQYLLPLAPSWNPPGRGIIANTETVDIKDVAAECRNSNAQSSMRNSLGEHLSVPDLPDEYAQIIFGEEEEPLEVDCRKSSRQGRPPRPTQGLDHHPSRKSGIDQTGSAAIQKFAVSIGTTNMENEVEYVVSWDDSNPEMQTIFFPADDQYQSVPDYVDNARHSPYISSEDVSTQVNSIDYIEASGVLNELLSGNSLSLSVHSTVWMNEQDHEVQSISAMNAPGGRAIVSADNNEEPTVVSERDVLNNDGLAFGSFDGADIDGHHRSSSRHDLHDEQLPDDVAQYTVITKRPRRKVSSPPSNHPIIEKQERPVSAESGPAMSTTRRTITTVHDDEDKEHNNNDHHDLNLMLSGPDPWGTLGALQKEAVSSFLYEETIIFPQRTEDDEADTHRYHHHHNDKKNATSSSISKPPSLSPTGIERRGSSPRNTLRDQANLSPSVEPPQQFQQDQKPVSMATKSQVQAGGGGQYADITQKKKQTQQQGGGGGGSGGGTNNYTNNNNNNNNNNKPSYVLGQVQQWRAERKMLRDVQLSKWAQERITNTNTTTTTTPKNGNTGGSGSGGGATGGGDRSISSVSDVTDDYNKTSGTCGMAFCVQDALKERIPL